MSDATSPGSPPEGTVSAVTLPVWASVPFHTFLDRQELVTQLLHLSMAGISVLRGMPRAIEALSEVDSTDAAMTAKRLDRAKKEAALAEREVKSGFPLLHEQVTIALWAALENFIRTFLSCWLRNYPNAMSIEQVARLRIRVGEYEALDADERCLYVVDLLEQELSISLRNGVTRFESVLGLFELNGAVDEAVAKDLYELQQVRNVLVHRNAVADKRLMRACPWLEYKVGERMVIPHESVGRYFNASARYIGDLTFRVGDKLGIVGLREAVAARVGRSKPPSI